MITPVLTRTTLADAPLTERERVAIQKLQTRLHETLEPGQLRSLILYGSKARGDSHPISDIDLLVVLNGPIEDELDFKIRDLTHTENLNPDGETYIEPMIVGSDTLALWESYGEPIAQNIEREGIVIMGEPVIVKNVDKSKLVEMALETARTDLADAEILLEHGSPRGVVSKCYYVMLHATRAALLAKDVTPTSHSGTATMLGLVLVKPRLVDPVWSKTLGYMEKNRLDADYSHEKNFAREDAENAVGRAREFLATIENLIPKLLEP